MGKIKIGKATNKEQLQIRVVEKPVEIIKEVIVPEYITVVKEERIEVPVFHEVIREVEKIVEIPKIQIVEKPVYITKEVYNIQKFLKEQSAHRQTQKILNITTVLLVISIIANVSLLF